MWIGLTILVCFDFSATTILGVCLIVITPLIVFCILEARHCVLPDLQKALKREKHLRRLPNGQMGYDPYWSWELGTEAPVPGFAWRKWVDRGVLFAMLFAIPVGSIDAFTSVKLIPENGIVIGITFICFAVAWLLRQILTGALAQLRFIRIYQRGEI
jgi:hypothetical protein